MCAKGAEIDASVFCIAVIIIVSLIFVNIITGVVTNLQTANIKRENKFLFKHRDLADSSRNFKNWGSELSDVRQVDPSVFAKQHPRFRLDVSNMTLEALENYLLVLVSVLLIIHIMWLLCNTAVSACFCSVLFI